MYKLDKNFYKIISSKPFYETKQLLEQLAQQLSEFYKGKKIFFYFNSTKNDNNCKKKESRFKVEYTINSRKDKIIIAHELAHNFDVILGVPTQDDFEERYLDFFNEIAKKLGAKRIELAEILRDSIFNFGQHFFVKEKLEEYFDSKEIESKWIGKKGLKRYLFENGSPDYEKDDWSFKEDKSRSDFLNKLIQIRKAIQIADLYFALGEKNRELLFSKVMENETEGTKQVLVQLIKIIRESNIENFYVNKNKIGKMINHIYEELINLIGNE